MSLYWAWSIINRRWWGNRQIRTTLNSHGVTHSPWPPPQAALTTGWHYKPEASLEPIQFPSREKKYLDHPVGPAEMSQNSSQSLCEHNLRLNYEPLPAG